MSALLAGLFLAAFFVAALALVIFFFTHPQILETTPANKAAGPPRWSERLFSAAFCLVWSAGTLAGDFFVVRGVLRQIRALGYHPTEGEVIAGAVREKADGEGTSFDVDIEYAYRVEGQEYRGRRVRYFRLWGRNWVSQFVGQHPPRTPVTVYYDPADPAEAILLRELDGGPLWFALFLAPFNVVLVGFLAYGSRRLWCGGRPGRPPFVTLERKGKTHVRVDPMWPAAGGLCCFFVTTLVVALFAGCAGMPPSLTAMTVAWGIVLGSSALVYLIAARRTAVGKYDLVLDRWKKTLTVPKTVGGAGPVVVPLADVVSAEVVTVQDEENGTRYAPTLRWRATAGEVREGKLTEWSDKEHAERLVAWLRNEAGISG
jgi:hypothetical protein